MTDAKCTFDDERTLVLNATTGVSTNVVDLGDIEDNRFEDIITTERGFAYANIWLVVSVQVADTVGGTLTVSLQDSLTAAGSYADLVPDINSGAINIAAGTILLNVPLPRTMRRFLALEWETSDDWTTETTNVVSGHLVFGNRRNRALAS